MQIRFLGVLPGIDGGGDGGGGGSGGGGGGGGLEQYLGPDT